MKTKLLVACYLLALVAEAGAIECGPTVRTDALQKADQRITEVTASLQMHGNALLQEQERMLSSGVGTYDQVAFTRLQIEHETIESVQTSGERIASLLLLSITLTTIRDQMIDPRDKRVLILHLSNTLATLKTASTYSVGAVTKRLSKMTRPGIAVDVGNMRDAIAAVEKVVANCTR